jgi:hypothetical protein
MGQLKPQRKLGDNSSFTESTVVSTNAGGHCMCHFMMGAVSLSVASVFSHADNSDLAGDLHGRNPAATTADYYPNGFVGNIPATGGRYLKPSSSRPPWAGRTGWLGISGGKLVRFHIPTASPSETAASFTDNGGQIDNLTSLQHGIGVFKGKFNKPESG